MTVLVTGGAGFIGSRLAHALRHSGYDVVVLDNLSGGYLSNVPDKVRFIFGDITDEAQVDSVFEQNDIDYVYHLAAYAAENLSHFIKRYNYTNNLIGSVNLINAAVNHDVKCFVFTSSMAVYGNQPVPYHELLTPCPIDSYGIAKLAVERELAISCEMFGLPFVIFRPFNVYGPGQNIADRYRNVAGIFMNQLLQGRCMTIFGDGEQVRQFTYIDDILPPMIEAIQRPEVWGEVFNLGSKRGYTVNQLAERVADAMGCPVRTRHLPARHEVKDARVSTNKLRLVFPGYYERRLEDGLRMMAEWAKQHGARQTPEFANIEIMHGLPEAWR